MINNGLGWAFYSDALSPRWLRRIYEITPDDPGKLVNVSNRGVLGTGEQVLICGFIVQGTTPRPILMRALGPTLKVFGVAGAATDPMLRLFRGPSLLAENDDWKTTPGADSIPDGLAPGNDKESAIVVILEPGLYTAHASSTDQGVGLVEVFDLSALK